MASYWRPGTLDEALGVLAGRSTVVLAGGTDHLPARVGEPLDDDVLDITRVRDLERVEDCGDHWRIGALTCWADIRDAPLPPWFDALRLAAREVGGAQIQNAGTIGGNLCNASPAADGVPPLLALGASIELTSRCGKTTLPLEDFITGNRATIRRPDQLLTAVIVPKPTAGIAASHFLKLGARRYLVISIVMTAAAIEVDTRGQVSAARLVVGACSPVARTLPEAAVALIGRQACPGLEDALRPEHLQLLTPIDDIRADAAYRQEAALVLLKRTVRGLLERL
jgi:CO/xanthine dehydrogenase FAD-binding subunit